MDGHSCGVAVTVQGAGPLHAFTHLGHSFGIFLFAKSSGPRRAFGAGFGLPQAMSDPADRLKPSSLTFRVQVPSAHRSYSLNSLKGSYIWEYYRGY